MLALPTLARDANVLGVIVIEPFTGTFRRSRRTRPRVSTRRSCSTCGGRGALLARGGSRAHDEPLVPDAAPRAARRRTRAALASVSFEGDAELPAIAHYFAQPFEIAEPFTSRPGERTRYAALLDEVEARAEQYATGTSRFGRKNSIWWRIRYETASSASPARCRRGPPSAPRDRPRRWSFGLSVRYDQVLPTPSTRAVWPGQITVVQSNWSRTAGPATVKPTSSRSR